MPTPSGVPAATIHFTASSTDETVSQHVRPDSSRSATPKALIPPGSAPNHTLGMLLLLALSRVQFRLMEWSARLHSERVEEQHDESRPSNSVLITSAFRNCSRSLLSHKNTNEEDLKGSEMLVSRHEFEREARRHHEGKRL